MNFIEKSFSHLTTTELYAILRLRAEVFVLEQHCPYLDLDNLDQEALHQWLESEGEIIAYLRLFEVGIMYKDFRSLGRVVVNPEYRGKGYGHELMRVVMNRVDEITTPFVDIKISAQSHLQQFYRQHGFESRGIQYLEDGIPHRAMFYPAKL